MESANQIAQEDIAAASAEASAALKEAKAANQLAEQNRNDQLAAHEARFAELVVISTQRVSKTSSNRLLTVRNLGYQRITKPQLIGKDATIIRLKNVQACSSATFLISGKWYSSAAQLTFQDADGEWWSRAEGRPVKILSETDERRDWKRDAPLDTETYQLNRARTREKTAKKKIEGTDTSYDLEAITPVKHTYRGGECPN